MKINCKRISQDAFTQMISDSGILLDSFDPENPEIKDENIITATTGGITVSCTETTSDWGEDIDNVPNNMMEFKHHDSWEAKMSFTALCVTLKTIQLSLGAADIDETDGTVTPRNKIKLTDFKKVWWACNTISDAIAVCCLENGYSTGGFSLKTEKNGKGQLTMEITGHTSAMAQDDPPMKFYIIEFEDGEGDSDSDVQTLSEDIPEEY